VERGERKNKQKGGKFQGIEEGKQSGRKSKKGSRGGSRACDVKTGPKEVTARKATKKNK